MLIMPNLVQHRLALAGTMETDDEQRRGGAVLALMGLLQSLVLSVLLFSVLLLFAPNLHASFLRDAPIFRVPV